MISIVLPTYNRKHIISKAIDSVLNQTYQDFELIIADDCSSDGTEEYVQNHYTDPRIRYVKNEVNLGAGGTRNHGIELAQGEYIAFIDSDTEWCSEKLMRQMELFLEHPDAGMVYSSFYKESPTERVFFPFEEIQREYLSGDIYGILLQIPLVDTPTMIIPRKILEELGSFCGELRGLEDYELSLRIAKHYPIYICDEPLVISYCQPGCVSENVDACLEARFYIMREFRDDLIQCDLYQDKLEELFQMCQAANKVSEYTIFLRKYLT